MQVFEKIKSLGIPVPVRLLNKKDLNEEAMNEVMDDGKTCGMNDDVSQKIIDTICFIVSLSTPKILKLVRLEFYDGAMVEWPMLNEQPTKELESSEHKKDKLIQKLLNNITSMDGNSGAKEFIAEYYSELKTIR